MPQINVIGQADIIIPRLEELVRFDIENSGRLHEMKVRGEIDAHEQAEGDYGELVEASRALVEEIWGKLPSGGKEHNLQSGSNGYTTSGRELEGHNVLSHSTDANIVGCVVYGWNPLSDSIRPNLRDSFVLGHNAISGSGFVSSHSIVEKYTTFVELEPHILSYLDRPIIERWLDRATKKRTNVGKKLMALSWLRYLGLEATVSGWKRTKDALDVKMERLTHEINLAPERFLRALYDFSRVVPDSKHEWTANWFRETRPDIKAKYCSLITRLYDSLPKDKQEELQHIKEDPKVVSAAHELDSMLQYLSFSGDTYHVDIGNSVVFGYNAGNDMKGGIIQDSIFAGCAPLSRANVRIWNSYLVTPRGTRYIREGVLGNPKIYQTIPKLVQERHLSLLDLHHVR